VPTFNAFHLLGKKSGFFTVDSGKFFVNSLIYTKEYYLKLLCLFGFLWCSKKEAAFPFKKKQYNSSFS